MCTTFFTEYALAGPVLEEIIVTARKRSESLQETPIAVTALSGADLVAAGLISMPDLEEVVPNVDVSIRNAASIFIRGVGARNAGANLDSGVAIYLDEVYLGRPDGSMLDNNDVQSVQVLRGPQGTLFGKNATGGAVLYTTNLPVNEFEGSARVRLGNFNSRDAFLAVNVPLVDRTLATRLSLTSVKRDGFTHNLYTGEDMNDADRQAAVLQFQFTSENSSTNVNLNWSETDQAAQAGKCHVPPHIQGAGWQNALLDEFVIIPSTGKSLVEHCEDVAQLDRDDVLMDLQPNIYKAETRGASTNLQWVISDLLQFKSITAWRYSEAGEAIDVDAMAIPLLHRTNFGYDINENRETNQYSQEFQFTGTLPDASLEYVSGLYLFRETTDPGTAAGPVGPFFNTAGIPNLAQYRNPAAATSTESNSYALFSQVDWNLSPRWRVTGGLRYTWERRELELNAFDLDLATLSTGAPAIPVPVAEGVYTFPAGPDSFNYGHGHEGFFDSNRGKVQSDDWTPMLSLQYFLEADWVDAGSMYFTISEGFMSGGISETPDLVTGELIHFDPEEVTSYEIGLKLDLLQNRLRFNATAFYLDYRDRQLTTLNANPETGSIAVNTINAEKSWVAGLETELLWYPVDALQLTLNATFNHGEIEKFDDNRIVEPDSVPDADCVFVEFQNGQGADVCPVDRSDEDLPRLPTQSYYLAAQYLWSSSAGSVIPRLQYSLRKDINNCFDRASCLSGVFEGDQKNLSALLSWISPDERWRATLWGKNLTDSRYVQGGSPLQDYSRTVSLVYSTPRTYGVDLEYKW